MWVDQPAGVGFSTGIGTHNEQGVANNMFVSLVVTVVIFWLFNSFLWKTAHIYR